MSVLLPAPFSPTRAWTSPRRTSRSTPSSARTPANRLRIARATSRGRVRSGIAGFGSLVDIGPSLTRCRAWRGRTGPVPVYIARPTVAWVEPGSARNRRAASASWRAFVASSMRIRACRPRPSIRISRSLGVKLASRIAPGVAPAKHQPVDGQGTSRPAREDLAAAELVDVGEDVEHGKDLAGARGEPLGERRAGLRLHHAEPPGGLVEGRPRGPLLGQVLDRAERPGGPEERHLARVHARGELPGIRLGGRPRRVGIHPLPEGDRPDLDRTPRGQHAGALDGRGQALQVLDQRRVVGGVLLRVRREADAVELIPGQAGPIELEEVRDRPGDERDAPIDRPEDPPRASPPARPGWTRRLAKRRASGRSDAVGSTPPRRAAASRHPPYPGRPPRRRCRAKQSSASASANARSRRSCQPGFPRSRSTLR